MDKFFKSLVHRVKLFIVVYLELLFRFQKFMIYHITGKHEIERVCESNTDLYCKTMKIDEWLSRTRCQGARDFMEDKFTIDSKLAVKAVDALYHGCNKARGSSKKQKIVSKSSQLEQCDEILGDILAISTNNLARIILESKDIDENSETSEFLHTTLFRILAYKLTLLVAEQLAATKYDARINSHTSKLISLWNNLLDADNQQIANAQPKVFPPELSQKIEGKNDIVSSRWSHIGFQGEDPGTDFRGMGMLGLMQLQYLSERSKFLAIDLLRRSLDEQHSYPFAIVGINVTYNLLSLYRDGSMKHLYYDTGDALFRGSKRSLQIISIFNDLYVELFLRFDCYWHESKPVNIFEFKTLMEKFVNIVTMNLMDRNFSLKFIY